MNEVERTRLLHGPYAPPDVRRGEPLYCEYRKCEIPVRGLSDAPIPWPTAGVGRGKPSLIVCGDLSRAILVESAVAIGHWWDVGHATVSRWRAALGVGPETEGKRRLNAAYYAERPQFREAGRVAIAGPEAREKARRALEGRPPHPNTLAGLRRYWAGRRREREGDE